MNNQGTTNNNNEITEEGMNLSSNDEGTSSNNNEITEEGSGTSSNNNEITEEGTTSNNNDIKEGMNSTGNNNDISEGTTNNNNEITEEGMNLGTTSSNDEATLMDSSGTTSNNNEITKEDSSGTTSNNNEITEERSGTSSNNNEITEEGTTNNNNDIKEGMNATSNNNDISEDLVTVFVAYDGKWEYDRKEWFFENSKSSIMVVPKHITLSQITEILQKQLKVNKEDYRLKLEVHYRTGSPWFPVTEIQNDQDLSVFISETSKTKLPLCVTSRLSFLDDDEERRKGHVRVLVAYNGKWRWDGEKWLFENSEGSIVNVSKYVTLSEITDMLYEEFEVDQDSYDLKLEVHYRGGSPWFPVTEIQNNQDLSLFISESWETKLSLCVTRVAKVVAVEEVEHGRKDNKAEKRLFNAIQKNDWVKAREIIKTEEVTWTSKLDDDGNTALHFAVGVYKDNKVVRDILRETEINREILVTTKNIDGKIPAHIAASFENLEALRIMVEHNKECLFIRDDHKCLPIDYALATPSKETVRYLFSLMKIQKWEYDILFRTGDGLQLLSLVIEKGLIDLAYVLIKDYPSMATEISEIRGTPLEWIIRKPDLFYSGTRYNLWQRFVYHYVPIKNNSFGSTTTADVENQETPKKDNFVHTRFLHNVISKIYVKLWETTLLKLWETTLLHGWYIAGLCCALASGL